MSVAATASTSVPPRTPKASAATGRLVAMEPPKSPESARSSQRGNRSG
jgi:hypothetical protein